MCTTINLEHCTTLLTQSMIQRTSLHEWKDPTPTHIDTLGRTHETIGRAVESNIQKPIIDLLWLFVALRCNLSTK
jgi:hypothetical protein